jgi:hypothetical protein
MEKLIEKIEKEQWKRKPNYYVIGKKREKRVISEKVPELGELEELNRQIVNFLMQQNFE